MKGDFIMTRHEFEGLKHKFKVGDIVVMPKEITHLIFEGNQARIAQVIEMYPHIFIVEYENGFKQGINYVDATKINKIVKYIA